ncbi:MAG: hypothetical protein HN370_03875 [Phycisphaerales bacterium]|jgi:hypothetical protein|nr:hypothetical protein [Phycisphaerales bacterium]
MSSTSHRWLIALSDPQGEVPLPAGTPPKGAALDALIRAADYHGTTPAVRSNLPRLKDLPHADPAALDATLETLSARLLAHTAHTMALAHQGRTIETRLREATLPGVIFKGPSLAETVYPRPALRSYTDIDVLVPRASFAAAGKSLLAMGLTAQHDYKTDLKHDHDH